MSRTLKSLAFASSFACLAASSPTLAQSPPPLGAPVQSLNMAKIHDANGRLVGVPLAPKPFPTDGLFDLMPHSAVAFKFDSGTAVLTLDTIGTVQSYEEFGSISDRYYYADGQCAGRAYLLVEAMPPAGVFKMEGNQRAGYSATGTVIYPKAPYQILDRVWRGATCAETPLRRVLAGEATTTQLQRFKLPFVTR